MTNIKDLISGQQAIAQARITNATIEAEVKINQAKKAFEIFKNGVITEAKASYDAIQSKLAKLDEKLERKYMARKQKLAVKSMAVATIKDEIAEVESTTFNL